MKKAIIFLALAMFVVTVHAQRNSFIDRYLELRQPTETEDVMIEVLGKEDIQALPIEVATEEERQRAEKFWANVEQLSIVADMSDSFLSACQVDNLLYPFEKLMSINMGDMDSQVSLMGSVKEDRLQELVIFWGEADMQLFVNIEFGQPIALQDFMENPTDVQQLISFNSSGEQDNALIQVRSELDLSTLDIPAFPGTGDSPITLEIAQVNGQYYIHATGGTTFFGRNRLFAVKPRIYGSNPGNTYVVSRTHQNGVAILHDRYGQIIGMARDFTPVYVLGCDKEIAAFIFREGSLGYSLFETPEIYTAIVERSGSSISIAPRRDFRFSHEQNVQSITPTENGYFRVVKEDGSVEYIPIRRARN